ncbi:unnamed protein product, partial [Gordionus sp. m RMFG-2023]
MDFCNDNKYDFTLDNFDETNIDSVADLIYTEELMNGQENNLSQLYAIYDISFTLTIASSFTSTIANN